MHARFVVIDRTRELDHHSVVTKFWNCVSELYVLDRQRLPAESQATSSTGSIFVAQYEVFLS